jgi:hypothetical protein
LLEVRRTVLMMLIKICKMELSLETYAESPCAEVPIPSTIPPFRVVPSINRAVLLMNIAREA